MTYGSAGRDVLSPERPSLLFILTGAEQRQEIETIKDMLNPKPAALLLSALLWCCAGSSGGPAGKQGGGEITEPSSGAEGRQEQELNVTLTLDRSSYPAGALLSMTLRVENPTSDPLTLDFSDGQRFDFVIRDAGGGERWRWSDGEFFIQVLGEEVVAPADSLVYEARMEEGLEPGSYTVVGVVTARERSLRDSVEVEVEVGGGR